MSCTYILLLLLSRSIGTINNCLHLVGEGETHSMSGRGYQLHNWGEKKHATFTRDSQGTLENWQHKNYGDIILEFRILSQDVVLEAKNPFTRAATKP